MGSGEHSNHKNTWKKGQSGNPKGIRKGPRLFKFAEQCRQATPELFNFLLGLALHGKLPMKLPVPGEGGVIDFPPVVSAEVRVRAAEILLNRGWGKPGDQIAHLQSGAQGLLDKKIAQLETMTSDELRKRRDELRAIEAVQQTGAEPLRVLAPVPEAAETEEEEEAEGEPDEQEHGEPASEPVEPDAA